MHALLFSLLLSAPEDIVAWVDLPSNDMELTAPEKVLVGTAVNGTFGVSAANVLQETCGQNLRAQYNRGVPPNWNCRVEGKNVSLSVDAFYNASMKGQLADPTDPTLPKRDSKYLNAAQIVQHNAVTQELFALDMSEIYQFQIKRDPLIEGRIWAIYWGITKDTKTAFMVAAVAGLVTGPPIGEVPQS